MGIFPFEKALLYAKERDLDLIEISGNVTPPVCKAGDLGKFLYQKRKKEKVQKSKQKIGKLKGIRISPRISEHDLETKINLTKKFLLKNYKVKAEIFLKGREKALMGFAREKLINFFQKIETDGNIEIKKESDIKKTPRGLEIIISRK